MAAEFPRISQKFPGNFSREDCVGGASVLGDSVQTDQIYRTPAMAAHILTCSILTGGLPEIPWDRALNYV